MQKQFVNSMTTLSQGVSQEVLFRFDIIITQIKFIPCVYPCSSELN